MADQNWMLSETYFPKVSVAWGKRTKPHTFYMVAATRAELIQEYQRRNRLFAGDRFTRVSLRPVPAGIYSVTDGWIDARKEEERRKKAAAKRIAAMKAARSR